MKPKLLLLSAKWNCLTKTYFVFIKALERFFDVIKYGPGFVNIKNLEIDILNILEKIGGADLIIIDELIIFKKLNLKNYQLCVKINKFYFDLKRFVHTKGDFPLNLNKIKIPVFVSLLISDYYNFSQEQIDRIQNLCNPYYICWGEDFILPKNETSYFTEEFYSYVNDNVANFVKKHRERVVPILYMVDEQEFLDFSQKRIEWCIPGANYHWRKKVKEYLKERGIKYRNRAFIISTIQKLDLFRVFEVTRYDWLLSLYYKTFRNLVNKSWCTFTCGSGLNYPVRKFFEIPAFASLLVCNPCAAFSELGFKDTENCFIVNTLEELAGIIEKINDRDMVRKMTIAGQKLVKEKHTAQVRARQFFNIYNTIAQNNFVRAYWSKGDIWCQCKDAKTILV